MAWWAAIPAIASAAATLFGGGGGDSGDNKQTVTREYRPAPRSPEEQALAKYLMNFIIGQPASKPMTYDEWVKSMGYNTQPQGYGGFPFPHGGVYRVGNYWRPYSYEQPIDYHAQYQQYLNNFTPTGGQPSWMEQAFAQYRAQTPEKEWQIMRDALEGQKRKAEQELAQYYASQGTAGAQNQAMNNITQQALTNLAEQRRQLEADWIRRQIAGAQSEAQMIEQALGAVKTGAVPYSTTTTLPAPMQPNPWEQLIQAGMLGYDMYRNSGSGTSFPWETLYVNALPTARQNAIDVANWLP